MTRPARGLVAASVLVVAGIGGLALFGNWALHGSLLGGRVDLVRDPGHLHAIDAYFRFSPVHWAGLLASPSRGLFVFSPVLLFGLPGLVRCLRGGCGSVARLASASALASFGSAMPRCGGSSVITLGRRAFTISSCMGPKCHQRDP